MVWVHISMLTMLNCTLLVVAMTLTVTCASRVSICIDRIDQWMATNRLAMNLMSYGVLQVTNHPIYHLH